MVLAQTRHGAAGSEATVVVAAVVELGVGGLLLWLCGWRWHVRWKKPNRQLVVSFLLSSVYLPTWC